MPRTKRDMPRNRREVPLVRTNMPLAVEGSRPRAGAQPLTHISGPFVGGCEASLPDDTVPVETPQPRPRHRLEGHGDDGASLRRICRCHRATLHDATSAVHIVLPQNGVVNPERPALRRDAPLSPWPPKGCRGRGWGVSTGTVS